MQVRVYVVVAVGDASVLPFRSTAPMPLSILHELAPEEVHDKVAFAGGMMAAMGDTVNEVIVTGLLGPLELLELPGQEVSGGGTALQLPHTPFVPQVCMPVVVSPQEFGDDEQNCAELPCEQAFAAVQAVLQDERSEYCGFDDTDVQV